MCLYLPDEPGNLKNIFNAFKGKAWVGASALYRWHKPDFQGIFKPVFSPRQVTQPVSQENKNQKICEDSILLLTE